MKTRTKIQWDDNQHPEIGCADQEALSNQGNCVVLYALNISWNPSKELQTVIPAVDSRKLKLGIMSGVDHLGVAWTVHAGISIDLVIVYVLLKVLKH